MALTILIVGGGNVGTYLASLLVADGHRVTLIEMQPDRCLAVQRDAPAVTVVAGDGTDPATLDAAGIRRADVVTAVTGADEANLVVTSLARFEFGVSRTIARVHHPRNAWMFTAEMGVDVALNQADLLAHLIVEEMSLGELMTLLKLRRGAYALVEERVHPAAPAVGRSIRELGLPDDCRVAAVIRGGDLLPPRGDLTLLAGDEVLIVAPSPALHRLTEILGAPSPSG